ncbi:KilA-N domain-containing protein [Janthinobacterium sp. GMG1]|uniref:KilA-N domain-containing protein n=1 Tax=Janthinobacterium sp. GMG1 TaxID=3096007 RepID=UPI002ACA94A2|nr:KilA-N domain-containing protein [Janthinobacterium sp. GMG1]MDZ5633970.1 KilA-N domain-containing protein [Janthinobacterium sp. GMG1]
MTEIVQHKGITIANTLIAVDKEGRFCLNDLHKAGGAESRHQPAFFFRRSEIQELEAELNSAPAQSLPTITTQGRNGGTYVCKELVYAYAMWISPKFHLEVIRTFDAVATGQAPVAAPKPSAISPAKEFRAIFGIARLIGLDKNAAAISANQGTAALTGVNMLQLMERTHLATPSQEIYYTPTELGSRFVKSAKAFNQLLAQAGLQESISGHWVPTEKGREHALVMDTGKAHSSGTPIQQVKWRDSVLAEVAL